jgi:anti-sigma factor RsiW
MKGMKCRHVERLIEGYVDGTLVGAASARVAAHAAGCARCDGRIEAARRLQAVLAAEPPVRAPRGFTERVMDAVYRQALAGPAGAESTQAETAAPAPAARPAPSRMYRRLGLSFVLTAGVLAVSLLVPRLAYPTLVGRGGSTLHAEVVGGAAVKGALAGADNAVRGILRERESTGGTR